MGFPRYCILGYVVVYSSAKYTRKSGNRPLSTYLGMDGGEPVVDLRSRFGPRDVMGFCPFLRFVGSCICAPYCRRAQDWRTYIVDIFGKWEGVYGGLV